MKSPFRTKRSAAALVVTLSLIVIITVLVLAFFANSTMNQQLENSSTDRTDTDLLARSALELIVTDLRQEMLGGSMDVGANGNVLRPLGGSNMVPERVLVNPALTNTAFNNLVKQSASNQPMFTASMNSAVPRIAGASSISTTTPARNNRRIGIQRWNAPLLVQSNFDASQAPDWIYLGADGITNVTSKNVIGRFAFNVYNVGGLLNINVAGAPTALSAADKLAIKGTPAGATLDGIIPGILDGNEFIKWRNAQSGLSPASYVSGILSATNGFREPVAGDNRFVSRQDLIRYARQHPAVLGTNALPYLTTFSLERNTPSWGPMTNAPAAAFAYLDNSGNAASTNRLLTMAKHVQSGTITSFDLAGQPSSTFSVSTGDPLVRQRFPLDRLRWITSTGAAPGVDAEALRSAFGLEWNPTGGNWKYAEDFLVGSGMKRIASLAEVAAAGREPNFFELLKAAILSGSLGKEAGDAISANGAFDRFSDYQVIQIGCNIIDQFRGDDFPTRVRFDSTVDGVIMGVVDLPYLNKLFTLLFRPEAGQLVGEYGSQSVERRILGGWLVPEFWRPHSRSIFGMNAAAVDLRLKVDNAVFTMSTHATAEIGIPTRVKDLLVNDSLKVPGVAPADFRERPDVVRSGSHGSASTDGLYGRIRDTGGFEEMLGLNVGFMDAYSPTNRGYVVKDVPEAMRGGGFSPKTPTRVEVDVLNGADWVPYDVVKSYRSHTSVGSAIGLVANNNAPGSGLSGPDLINIYAMPADLLAAVRGTVQGAGDALLKAIPVTSVGRSDPRTDRFGLSAFASTQMGFLKAEYASGTGRYYDPKTLPKNTKYEVSGYNPEAGGLRAVQRGGGQFTASGWFNGNNLGGTFAGNYPGALTDNRTNSMAGSVYYTDNDGVQRRALGAYSSYLMNQTDRTPIMLNRRFFSVGDLGYIHRGEPWKNLDFFTAQSADAGLLDIFTTSDFGLITEGKIDLNSAPAAVLQAYLTGTVMNEASAASTFIGTGSVASIADDIRDEVKARPMINKSELVTRFDDASELRSALELDKARHETYIRGLADIVQTRTWNLMIDVIVQKGVIAKTSTDLKDFLVEGERRYWLHIAIDRFTGEIVDRRLEAVYE